MYWDILWIITLYAFFSCLSPVCFCQETCYPAAGVAGIVVATIIVTVVVMGLLAAASWRFWKIKKVQKKQPEHNQRESQKQTGDFAFDNPYFREQEEDETDSVQQGKSGASVNNKSPLRSSKHSDISANKGKKTKTAKGHHFIFGGGGQNRKQRTMDDTCIAAEPERTVVALKGHDFTGLGFNICGNMRDGILVKDVLHRGPASESGRIKAGDRIISVTVSFTNIVYEDALTILSYASPYDVQLELERTMDKSSNMPSSPAGSKRLGSGSFSTSGPKLFHPLYRSQSIDDLTQIDRDTFPSHGFGPRRSQSVGVAAHKLAAHFKNSDTRLEEKDRPSTSAILSTTGSLNEKMLANVMADGAHHKCGLHWEKKFEDNLDGEAVDIDDSKRENVMSSKKASAPKGSASSADDDKTSEPSEERSSYYKRMFRSSSKRDSKQGKEILDSCAETSSEVQTTAQIHQQVTDGRDKRSKTMAEASDAVWQLDQSIRDADSDFDSSSSYPWREVDLQRKNFDTRASVGKNANTRRKNSLRRDIDEESNASDDSLDGEKHRRKKKHRHKTSSLGDLTHMEEAVNREANVLVNKVPDTDKERPPSRNFRNEQRTSNRNSKTPDIPYREQNNLTDFAKNNPNIPHSEDKYSGDMHTNRNPPIQCTNATVAQLCNKEKRMERTVLNPAHSPKLSVKSPKAKPDSFPPHNDPPYQKVQHYQHTSSYSSSTNSSESQCRLNERPMYSERPDLNINSRNISHQYIPNSVNSPACEHPASNRTRFSPHHYQQRPPYLEYQKPQHVVDQYHHYDDLKRMEPPRNGPPPYYQALRKANPAGMFTQINPFQQPSNRQRNNFPSKPWTNKESSMNGADAHYSVDYAKSGQVTTSDSSSRPRSRLEPPPYPQKMMDSGHSKTILISTFDSANNNHPMNFRQMRK